VKDDFCHFSAMYRKSWSPVRCSVTEVDDQVVGERISATAHGANCVRETGRVQLLPQRTNHRIERGRRHRPKRAGRRPVQARRGHDDAGPACKCAEQAKLSRSDVDIATAAANAETRKVDLQIDIFVSGTVRPEDIRLLHDPSLTRRGRINRLRNCPIRAARRVRAAAR